MSPRPQGRKYLLPGVPDPRRSRISEPPAGAPSQPPAPAATGHQKTETPATQVEEIGGRGGLDPTRYGDWEINGRCVDF
ncbi:MAG: DUF1674 domain-containing protein [Alphaproteobacteria bacterium]|nr:DUF1674 domain-containing protein [Alphaproteobacteria bacterium]